MRPFTDLMWIFIIVLYFLSNGLVKSDSTALDNPKHYLPHDNLTAFSENLKQLTVNNHSLYTFIHRHHQQHLTKQYEAFRRLHYVEPVGGEAWWAPIDDVLVAFPLESTYSVQVQDKFIVGPTVLKSLNKGFVLYAAGIAEYPEFEEEIAGKYGISVHAFDCTIPASTQLKNGVHFHHWCFGRKDGADAADAEKQKQKNSFEDNEFSRRSENKTFVFHTISETKQLLHHHHIHALKMDIEGFEWDILQKDIIENTRSEDLPDQVLVEVHAVGANPRWVPRHLTADKIRRRVNEMVLGMWKRGYRVVYKLTNPQDRHCADITFLRVYGDGKLKQREV